MELRKDYLLNRYVIVSAVRGKRPSDFETDNPIKPKLNGPCFFCPGNESSTTPTLGQIGSPWKIRWFINKFAFLEPEGKFAIATDNKYFTFSDAYGYHEVLVETNNHEIQMYDMSDFELKEILKAYKSRIDDLSARPHIKYVHVFKNHGKEAGTSIKHSHSQIAALNHVPPIIKEKLDAVQSYTTCPYCEIINIEKTSYRRCFENNSFVAFTPYASRYGYEIWVFPKKHYNSIILLDEYEMLELAQILKKILSRLRTLNASFNLSVHNTPKDHEGKELHFHIEICPRMFLYGGLEIGSGVISNSVSPEDAAKFYRGEL
jgi:UDPglucose--hexose-1-phosphate uridylyltransferase